MSLFKTFKDKVSGKDKISAKDKKRLKEYEEGKIFQLNKNIDNKEYLKNGYNK